MRYTTRRSKTAKSSQGAGSFWLCFSDLMSALLLIFVLVMFYSVYQYLDMLEIKTAELMRQSGLLDEKEAQLTLKDEELKASQEKLTQSEQELITQQAKLLLFEEELNSSEAMLSQQRTELEEKNALLESQQSALDQAQAQLSQQQALLDQQQLDMDAAQALLDQQQNQMAQQQEKLDALVGVRARIIASLAQAMQEAGIRATVDQQTGSITLDANVLFDVAKSELKEEGKRVLDEFLPVYLSVLMDPQNSDNIAEIIIEGHTDTDGTYMSNLKLSQERALSVMEYILADDYNQITGGQKRRLRQIATANGRSYSNPIYAEDGTVDKAASRRVEFKFRLQDEQMIEDMRELLETME